MSTSVVRRFPVGTSMLVVVLGVVGFLGALSGQAEILLGGWVAVAGLCLFGIYTIKGDLLAAVLVWFIAIICLHEELWREPDLFLFALTIPRIMIVLLVVLFGAMAAIGRFPLQLGRPVGTAILVFAAYLTYSAFAGGFETRSPVSVHYRLISGYLFPFVVFWLMLHALRRERDFRRVAVFFAALAVYLTFTGWCERLDLRALLWPSFIGDPSVGIHWGRVRGPFVSSPAMGLALVFCFFSNLVLARHTTHGRQWLLYALDALMLPVIFWTRTRSVWLAFALCMLIWLFYSSRRLTRIIAVSLMAALVMVVAVLNMENFLGAERAKGGLTDVGPILLRIGLAEITAEMVADHPLTGVGFGHFRDVAPRYGRRPSSPYQVNASTMEHNNMLSIVAETGLIGLALYLAVILLLLRLSVRLFRRMPPRCPGFVNRDLIVMYWIVAAAFIVDGMFRETTASPFANTLFFGLSAMVVALDRRMSSIVAGDGPGDGPADDAAAGPFPSRPVAARPLRGPGPRTAGAYRREPGGRGDRA